MVQTHPPSDPLSSFGRVNAHFDSLGEFVPVLRLVLLEPAGGKGGRQLRSSDRYPVRPVPNRSLRALSPLDPHSAEIPRGSGQA